MILKNYGRSYPCIPFNHQNGQMEFYPGERFSYNNAGFILLGLVVEQITGMEFTDYVEKNIFQRCGMILLTPHIKDNDQTYYGYGVWMLVFDNTIFKYFVMGSDPGVIMQSSVYPKSNLQAHIIGNINKGAGMIASKIDEVIYKEL